MSDGPDDSEFIEVPLEQAESEPVAEVHEGDPEARQGDDPEPENKPLRDDTGKFKSTVQARIDELTRRTHEAERRASRAEVDLASRSADKADAPVKPTADKYGSYDEFVEALTDWKAEEREAKRVQSERTSAQGDVAQVRTEMFRAKAEIAKATLTDYDQVVGASEIPIAGHVASALMEADRGPEIAYHLAQNPDIAERLNSLSPARAAIEMGKLESALSAPAAKVTSNAPAPITPVRSGSSTKVSLANADMDTYIAERRKQGARY